MLSKISESQKDKHCISLRNKVPRGLKFIETERRMEVARDWGDGEWALLFNWHKDSILQDEKEFQRLVTQQ